MDRRPQIANPDYVSFTEHSLASLRSHLPAFQRALEGYAEASLKDYLKQTLGVSQNPLQSRTDLFDIVYDYAASLLGEDIAATATQEFKTQPAVLTANHHGVDFFAQSVQTSLIFSLREIAAKPAKTVLAFACGNVSLNNPTYPRGLLFYHIDRATADVSLPLKLPVFPGRYKRQALSIVDAYDSNMLARAEQQLAAMVRNQQLSPALAATAKKMISEDYRDPSVLQLPSYSQQAVVLNNRIWKYCFQQPETAPEMVSLELEEITRQLLLADLTHEDSLIWQILFNPILRTQVLSQLDGNKVCWDRSKLVQHNYLNPAGQNSGAGGGGTVFFWAINDVGRRVPLSLLGGSHRSLSLQGRDEQGKLWEIPFNAKAIMQALQSKRLLPSLFICYTSIAFARGISCCGGYFQAEYLADMQQGLVQALGESTDHKTWAERITQVPSNICLSGMQPIVRALDDNLLLPAGPVEMIASGGLTEAQYERMHSLKIRDLHLAGITETLPDIQHLVELPADWCLRLVEESNQLLRDRVLII